MGRVTSWLAAQRPAMVEVLQEMEKNSTYTSGGSAHGDLSMLLARLAQVAAGTGGRPRSLAAMRQAWWRWTTDGPQAATPPVHELALIVRHGKNHGWLRHLTNPPALALIDSLMRELEDGRALKRGELQVAWSPTARVAVDGLMVFLESRIVKRGNEEGGDYWGAALPAALVVQEEVRTMFREVSERLLLSLATPYEIFESPLESDSFIQPFEGWPEAFRGMARDMAEFLNAAANEYEEIESSLIPSPNESLVRGPQRVKLFASRAASPEEHEPD